MKRFLAACACLLISSFAFAQSAPNTLSAEEKAAGWKLLFDGQSTKGWVAIGKSEFPKDGWSVKDGVLTLAKGPGGGDIVTEEKFTDFELVWDWKIEEGGNSGLKYNLPDPTKGVGCEYQLLDDSKHADAKLHGTTRQTGGLYDVLPPVEGKKLNPPGQWNSSRIVVKGNHVEHYLNGGKTAEFEFGSEALKAAVAASKFKQTKGWGEKTASPILLQDHNDPIEFRNIKIRPLTGQ
jgi:hypothetical protein